MSKYFSRLASHIGHGTRSAKASIRLNVVPSSYESTTRNEKRSGFEVNLEKATTFDKVHKISMTDNTPSPVKSKNVVPMSSIHTDRKVESVSHVKPQKTVKVKGSVVQHNVVGRRSETENSSKASDKDKYNNKIEKVKSEALVSQSEESSNHNKFDDPFPTKRLIRQKSNSLIQKDKLISEKQAVSTTNPTNNVFLRAADKSDGKRVFSTSEQEIHSVVKQSAAISTVLHPLNCPDDTKTYFEPQKQPFTYKQPEMSITQTQKSSVDINIGAISVEVYQEKQKALQTSSSIQQHTVVSNSQPSRSPRLSRYYLRGL